MQSQLNTINHHKSVVFLVPYLWVSCQQVPLMPPETFFEPAALERFKEEASQGQFLDIRWQNRDIWWINWPNIMIHSSCYDGY